MRKVLICSDSTCDLPANVILERNIHILPLKVCFNGVEYRDIIEMNPAQLFENVEKLNTLPKSAAATIDEFMDLFTKFVNEGYDIVYTGIGSDLSSSYQNAFIAKQNLDDEIAEHVFLVDSKNLSTGIGLLLMKLTDLRDQGLSAEELVKVANEITPRVRAQFSVKDLTFLHKGGRCSGTVKFFGTMLRIRPILRVIDGKILLAEKIFGRYEKALDAQIQDLISNIDSIDKDYLFVTHTIGDNEEEYILNNIPQEIKDQFKHIIVSDAGCVISTHCGKNTIGILYIKNEQVTM